MIHLFPQPFNALVIGSSGSIGSAFVEILKTRTNCKRVVELSRQTHPHFDLRDEASITDTIVNIQQLGPFELIIDATGSLTIDGTGPEKSLKKLQAATLNQSLWINCIGPSILMKNLLPSLTRGKCIYAKLSARVGSISDNKLGGWYSYRASKAAFNMLLQTAAIEHTRANPHSVFVALQPGTVASSLSAPFVKATDALKASDSVAQMLNSMAKLEPKNGAHFIDYRGQEIGW